jgi:hypothetical protein
MNKENLRKNLIELLTKEPSHVSLEKAVSGIPAEMRGKRPAVGSHSLYEELEHIRISLEDLVNYTIDLEWASPAWPDKYWPEHNEIIPDDKWNKCINGIRKGIEEAVQIVNQTKDLTAEIPHGEGRTYLREILLIIDHNSYHLGKVLQIRKMLGIWSGGV